MADVQDQLEILGTDHFDAVLIHDPKAIEPTLTPGGCLEGLKALKAKGVVRNVGYSPRGFKTPG